MASPQRSGHRGLCGSRGRKQQREEKTCQARKCTLGLLQEPLWHPAPHCNGHARPCAKNKSVKHADKPDSVHRRPSCENRWRDRHYSGPGVATTARCYLPANSAEPRQRWPTWYCCAQRLPVSPRSLRNLGGYRVSSLRLNVWLAPAGTRLRGFPDRPPLVAEDDLTRLCCSDPHLAVGSR